MFSPTAMSVRITCSMRNFRAIIRRLSQSRAIALDMESATIAANGFRFRVPFGTLLCVSDKPLQGEIKLAGMAGEFYRQRFPSTVIAAALLASARSCGGIGIRDAEAKANPKSSDLSRKEKMNPAYRPMLAILVDAPFDNKRWVFETKWDGLRAIRPAVGVFGECDQCITD
jgi:hypothetical protein